MLHPLAERNGASPPELPSGRLREHAVAQGQGTGAGAVRQGEYVTLADTPSPFVPVGPFASPHQLFVASTDPEISVLCTPSPPFPTRLQSITRFVAAPPVTWTPWLALFVISQERSSVLLAWS